jgi:hypothetical protein
VWVKRRLDLLSLQRPPGQWIQRQGIWRFLPCWEPLSNILEPSAFSLPPLALSPGDGGSPFSRRAAESFAISVFFTLPGPLSFWREGGSSIFPLVCDGQDDFLLRRSTSAYRLGGSAIADSSVARAGHDRAGSVRAVRCDRGGRVMTRGGSAHGVLLNGGRNQILRSVKLRIMSPGANCSRRSRGLQKRGCLNR